MPVLLHASTDLSNMCHRREAFFDVNEVAKFFDEVEANIAALKSETDLQALSRVWLRLALEKRYPYNFTWLGRPIIQFPTDILAIQEIIWRTKPDVIVETGIAHGGSLIFSSSMLSLLPGEGRVIGVDIDIRKHNREEIDKHPMGKRITLLEGSSVANDIVAQVTRLVGKGERVLVILDSNHTHEHVLQELQLYSPFVRAGGYLVVLDTIIEDLPADAYPNRPWRKGANPKTAVWEFLRSNDRFRIDRDLEAKLLITGAPDGYLECIKN
jgi:cephalosporin hydroxylase